MVLAGRVGAEGGKMGHGLPPDGFFLPFYTRKYSWCLLLQQSWGHYVFI
jgi:hypothetical protein